jgi:alkylation response protein AidB-like acyl-CoA dehydrogenase
VNLELTDEQKMLADAAADALSRLGTVASTREALDGAPLVDQWPTAREAGWTGLLIDEAYGGAGLAMVDAMVLLEGCGKLLAGAGLLGHLAASQVLNAAARAGDEYAAEMLPALAAGERRGAFVFARPAGAAGEWRTDSATTGQREVCVPVATGERDLVELTGTVGSVPDLPDAELIVVPALTTSGAIVATVLDAGAAGTEVTAMRSYDASRPLGELRLSAAPGRRLQAGAAEAEAAWQLGQALLAADALGVCETVLAMGVAYAKERRTFGRPIGSYQAIKHQLVEMLRLADRTRSLCVYAAYAAEQAPADLAIACACARAAAEEAAGYCTRTNIAVHGGIGATWEHDAPLFWRRAQLSRLLLGGETAQLDRIADELTERARGLGRSSRRPPERIA